LQSSYRSSGLKGAGNTLKEARATTEAQGKTLGATQAVVIATESLAGRIEASTRIQHLLFQEARATRELELLREIAEQVALLIGVRRAIRKAQGERTLPPWHPPHRWPEPAGRPHLAGLPDEDLPKCRAIAGSRPDNVDTLDEEAPYELKEAIASARKMLDMIASVGLEEIKRAGPPKAL
jgi:hypothetical protein